MPEQAARPARAGAGPGRFGWGAVVTHLSARSVALGVLLIAGSLVRMLCEERLLVESYPEYVAYSQVTKRMIPYVF